MSCRDYLSTIFVRHCCNIRCKSKKVKIQSYEVSRRYRKREDLSSSGLQLQLWLRRLEHDANNMKTAKFFTSKPSHLYLPWMNCEWLLTFQLSEIRLHYHWIGQFPAKQTTTLGYENWLVTGLIHISLFLRWTRKLYKLRQSMNWSARVALALRGRARCPCSLSCALSRFIEKTESLWQV